jgi:phosphate transport system substrate-binding protein
MVSKMQVVVSFVLALIVLAAPGMVLAEKLQIEGSTTVGPIADAFMEAFMKKYPGVQITVRKTGSGDGAAALVDDRCDIANMSRFMKEKEFKKAVQNGVFPVAHVVAMDGVSVCVHPRNPVKELTTSQIRDIFMGKITNWRQLGGPNMEIVPISRDSSSGTFETFHKLVMKKADMADNVETVPSNPAMHGRISKTPAAIGYLGLGFVDDDVKPLEVDGVMPSEKTIASGVYPVSRPLFMFTDGYPKLGSMVYKFVTFHYSEEGQRIVRDKGFIPLTEY